MPAIRNLYLCSLFACCICSLLVLDASAQFCQDFESPVADTLDASGYYPLKIGNRWEYVSDLNFALDFASRIEVVKDTLISDTLFYKLEFTAYRFQYDLANFGDLLIEGRTTYRYEAVVDGVLFSFFRDRITGEGIEFNRPFCSTYTSSLSEFIVGGGYERSYAFPNGATSIETALPALKFFGCCFGDTRYGYGIGKLETNGDPSVRTGLTYAKIDTTEFGSPLDSLFDVSLVAIEHELDKTRKNSIVVYPNPLSDQGTLLVNLNKQGVVSVVVADMLGRLRSRPIQDVILPAGEHRTTWHIDNFESGIYLLQLYINGGRVEAQKVLVVN